MKILKTLSTAGLLACSSSGLFGQLILEDNFNDGGINDVNFFSGATSETGFFTTVDNARTFGVEENGFLTVTRDNAVAEGTNVFDRRSNVESAWDFFAKPITLSVDGISAEVTEGTLANIRGNFSFFADGINAFNASDSVTLQLWGNGRVSLLTEINNDVTPANLGDEILFGTFADLTGVDVTLDGSAIAGSLNYSVSIHHGGTTTVETGMISDFAIAEWSDGAADDIAESRFATRIQSGGFPTYTYSIDEITISAVPEPSTYAMIFGALVLVFASVKRKLARNK